MPAPTSPQTRLAEAVALHRQGKLADAERLYQALLRRDPNQFEALHLYGVLQVQAGRIEPGVELIRRAVRLNPKSAAAHINLAKALAESGRPAEALASLDAALALDDRFPEAHVNRAMALVQLERLEEALAALDAALALKADYAEALVNRGHVLTELGRPDAALASLDQAIRLAPGLAEGHNNRANALKALGRMDEALAAYERALVLRPAYAEAYNNRANTLWTLGRPDEALAAFDRAIQFRPTYAEAHANRARLMGELGRFEDALGGYEAALEAKPDHTPALVGRGKAQLALGRAAEALASFDAALAQAPGHAEALARRGAALILLGRYGEACANLQSARGHGLEDADTMNNCGVAQKQLGRREDALASFDRAIELDPGYADAYANRANVLRELGRPDEALASAERGVALRSDDARAHNVIGTVLNELQRMDEALAAYQKALSLDPDYPEPAYNGALASLLLGRYEEGWRLYEARKRIQEPLAARSFDAPLWLGETDIAGKTLLLWWEQGLGDTLQFCRYAMLAEARGARVVLWTQAPLSGLLASLSPTIEVIERLEDAPPFDLHAPLMSLPLAFGTTVETIPAKTPYLSLEAAFHDRWKAVLGTRTRPRIGLAWSGNPSHRNDHNRSIPLAALLPALTGAAEWISLQKDVRASDAPFADSVAGLRRFEAELADFRDTAALIDQLDLVVTVDTSIAHLAGALGKPVWILLPHTPDFRWMLERSDSPWYPTARLFRQPAIGAWAPVLDELEQALGAWLEGSASPKPRRRSAPTPKSRSTETGTGPALRTWAPHGFDLQRPCDVAVVMPTTLRASLPRALASVFAQAGAGRIQVLVGVDKPLGSMDALESVCAAAPANCVVQALDPGYSTSVRHGGLWPARDGGAIRTVLSYLANAPLIAYLDDDNWWAPNHVETLSRAIAPVDWAFALRWFVHPTTLRPVCVDEWESVGPDAGAYKERFGGFVDPNCLMIKRGACADALPWWTRPVTGDPSNLTADRNVFDFLRRNRKGAGTGEASVFYLMNEADAQHPARVQLAGDAYARASRDEPAAEAG